MPLVPREERVRGAYLGGHEAAAISGFGRGTAFDAYAKIVHRREVEQTNAMKRGLLVEHGLVDFVIDRRKLDGALRDAFFLDDRVPFFGGSLDLVETPNDAPRIAHELKTTRSSRGGMSAYGVPGTPEVPPEVYAQIQWYSGLVPSVAQHHVWVYDMDTDDDPQEFVVPRDEKMIRLLRRNAEDFWHSHILTEIPPTPSARTDPESVAAVWPTADKAKEVPASLVLIEAAQAYVAARDREKAAEAEKDNAAGILKAAIRDGYRCRWPGGSVCWSAPGLGAAINHEAALEELGEIATKAGIISPDGYQALIHKHTVNKIGTRRLTVALKRGAK